MFVTPGRTRPGLFLISLLAPAVCALAAPQPGPTPSAGFAVLARSCFKCHGEGTRLSGLDLRTRDLALKGGMHGAAFVPGKAAGSRLYRMVAGLAKPQMPPTGGLPDADVQAIKAWIDAGARYPADARAGETQWWAFRPLRRPPVPQVRVQGSGFRVQARPTPNAQRRVPSGWPNAQHPIDAFLLARMRETGVRPNPPADRVTLIRRATFDLTGLPPTPGEVEAFVNDRSPDAWAKVIDRLLASPRYGERWGRQWLDLARFAESEGFKADETRPNAWRYRDYVIKSFNEDKPYDRFIREQLAGDEIDPHNPDALVATGFNRHYADESNARNIRLRRQEILNDVTDTVGSVVMGVTLGCARCHDHKYDPVSQKDYYRIQAFFAAMQPRDDLALVSPEAQAEARRREAAWDQATRGTRDSLAALEEPYRQRLMKGKRMPFPDEIQDAIDTPAAQRTPLQQQLYLKVLPQITLTGDEVGKAMKGQDKERWDALHAELAKAVPSRPFPVPLAIGITDVGRAAPKVHTLQTGVYDAPVEEVQPGFLSAIDTRPPAITPPSGLASTGRRTALAGWLTSPENPLTARVIVNRVWQSHFGRGIVPTTSDFGKAGEPPTHPELLDYLAYRFTQSPNHSITQSPDALGWSLKRLHRLMMTSAAYRQSSASNSASAAKDPGNRSFWRYTRWRLEAEALRDACLSASGELNEKMGGPSVFPDLPEGVTTRGGWPVSADAAERNRRSVYVFVRRNTRYPLFQAFDFPDTHEPCSRRSVTNTAPQALMLFNSDLALRWGRAMAGRLLREAPDDAARVERAYRLAFGRRPETEEREISLAFLRKQTTVIRARIEQGRKAAAPLGAPQPADPAAGAALVDFCHALLNSNEFLYVD